VTFSPVWREVPSRVAEPARVCWTAADMKGQFVVPPAMFKPE
jgi:hypothetical protein